MKRLAVCLVLVLVVLGGAVSSYAQRHYRDGDDGAYSQRNNRWNPYWDGRPNPRDGACFYMTAPFRGHHFCMRVGDRLPKLPNGFGDNISSIVIFGRARVRIFNDSYYRNGSTEVWRTVPDLRMLRFRGGHTWNNRVSSIIVY